MKKVSDMYLAAAFLSYGVPFSHIDRSTTSRQIFNFDAPVQYIMVAKNDVGVEIVSNPSLEDVERHFTNKTLWLPPSYPDAVRSIKSAIHSQ